MLKERERPGECMRDDWFQEKDEIKRLWHEQCDCTGVIEECACH